MIEIKRLTDAEKNIINNLHKEKQQKRETEKLVDTKITATIKDNFSDDKKLLRLMNGNRFDINGKDYENLVKYLNTKTIAEKSSNLEIKPYSDFLADLVIFKLEIEELLLAKDKENKFATKTTIVNINNEKTAIITTLESYKDKFGFLVDTNNKIDDVTTTKNVRKFKNADAQAFGGDMYLLSRMGDFYTRFGEEGFLSKIKTNFATYLTKKGLNNKAKAISNITNINELKELFTQNNKPIKVSVDTELDGKSKTQKTTMTELFIDSISPFTGNLDRYFGSGSNINDSIKNSAIDIKSPENIKLALEDLVNTNPQEFNDRLEKFVENFNDIEKVLEEQKKAAKDKKTKNLINDYIKNPNKLFFNGLALGYMQHVQNTTLQHLGNNNEVVRQVSGTVAKDIFNAGASIGTQIGKNLTLILGGNASYLDGKILPGVNLGANLNLGRGFAINLNAGRLMETANSLSVLAGISKNINIDKGQKKGNANVDLNIFAGVDLLNNYMPNAGVNIDRNKMLGIANFLVNLRTGLNSIIYDGLVAGSLNKTTLVDGLKTDKNTYKGIDTKLAGEIADDILPLLSGLGKLDKSNDSQEQLKAKIYIQNNITDNILTYLATKKYQNTNKISRGGLSFGTNDIVLLGVPFIYRILGNSFKKSNIYTNTKEEKKSVLETKNEQFSSEIINKLNKYFGRSGNDVFSVKDGIITVPTDITIMDGDNKTKNNTNIQSTKQIDTRKYNISIVGGELTISEVATDIEKKYIDVVTLNDDPFIRANFVVTEDESEVIFTEKLNENKVKKIAKKDIQTNGVTIDTRTMDITVNTDTIKAGTIEKKIYIDGTPVEIKIELPLGSEYKAKFLDKIITGDKKTLDGQRLTRKIKYADFKTYEKFSAEMKKENVNYTNAATFANQVLNAYNKKFPKNKVDFTFNANNQNNLLSFFVALISYDYAIGKVNNIKYGEDIDILVNKLDSSTKAKVNKIIATNKSLTDEDLARAKTNLLAKGHKDIYYKLLTVRDIATKSVFKVGGKLIQSRENMIDKDARGFGKRMIYYTNKSLDTQFNDTDKTIGDLRNYESEVKDIGFVLGYPGEKLASKLEIIKGSNVIIGTNEDDKLLRKYAFVNLIKNYPEHEDLNLASAIIDEKGDLIIDENTRVTADNLEFALYAHCNGNHAILAPGLKIIKKSPEIKKTEPILTGYGNLNISDREYITRMGGESKNIISAYVGQIITNVITTVKTNAKDLSGNTFDISILGKEIKVIIDGVEKTVKIIDIGGGKIQMTVIGSTTAEVYNLIVDIKGTINIGSLSYTATKVIAGNVSGGTSSGFPGSTPQASAPVTVTQPVGVSQSGGSTSTTFGNAGDSRGPLDIKSEQFITNPMLLMNTLENLERQGIVRNDTINLIKRKINYAKKK